jgi:hypothetical protein
MSEVKTFSAVYLDPKSRQTLAVSGAHGGLSADQASVVAHFYMEYGSVPTVMNVNLDPAGRFVSEQPSVKKGDLTRELQASVSMSPEAAIRIGRWLMKQGEAAKVARKQPNKGS